MSAPPPVTMSGAVQLFKVELVSGQEIQVQGREEKDWFEGTRDDYMANVKFTETTDLRDLDRLLLLELLVYRWTQHLASGTDYEGVLVDEDNLRKQVSQTSGEITRVKRSLGLNKASRDAADNAGNFADYLDKLQQRALMFGVHRNNQVTKALALFNELSAIVGTFDRSDDEERVKSGFRSEAEIVEWIRETAIPEYREIDEAFRKTNQRLWIKDM